MIAAAAARAGGARRPVGRRRLPGPAWSALLVVLAAAGAVERWVTFTRQPTNSDEALATLIGRADLHGHVSLFLWGQDFGGALEALPVGITTRLLGSSLLAQRLDTIVLGCLAPLLLYRVALRLVPRPAAVVAAAWLWLWPPFFIQWELHEYLYYVPTLVLGLGAWLLAMRASERGSDLDAAASGLLMGLAWWTNPNVIEYLLPYLVWLLHRGEGRSRRLGRATSGAVVGAAPWLVFNAAHHLTSLNAGATGSGASYSARLANFFDTAVDVLFGLRNEVGGSTSSHPHALHLLVLWGSVAVVAVAGVAWPARRRRGGAAGAPPGDLLGVLALPVLYALSTAVPAAHGYNPRYPFFGWPLVALLVARLVSWERLPSAVPAALALLLAAAGLEQVRLLPPRQLPPGAVVDAPYSYHALVAALEAHGQTRVLSSYWNAYVVDEIADGRVIATPALPVVDRHRAYRSLVLAGPAPTWLFFRASPQLAAFGADLGRLHVTAASYDVSGFVVVQPATAVLPSQVDAAALATLP